MFPAGFLPAAVSSNDGAASLPPKESSMRKRLAVLAATLALPLATAASQEMAAPRNVISIQPFNAMFTVFTAEYERAQGKAWTWGLGATNWSAGDEGDKVTYTSGDLKLRYYPSGAALMGFSIGGSLGFTSVASECSICTPTEESASGPNLGVLLEYQWLLGAKKNFAIALGAGAKALMISEDDVSASDFVARYPTARISIGWGW
jgi:hypothetical protein